MVPALCFYLEEAGKIPYFSVSGNTFKCFTLKRYMCVYIHLLIEISLQMLV